MTLFFAFIMTRNGFDQFYRYCATRLMICKFRKSADMFIISSFIPFKNGFIPGIYILLVYTIYILIYYIYSNNSIIKLKNLIYKTKKYLFIEQMFVSQLLYDLICNNLDSRLYHGCTVIGLCDVLQT